MGIGTRNLLLVGVGLVLSGATVLAQDGATVALVNPGFEQGLDGWSLAEPDGAGVALSDTGHAGAHSAKLSGGGAYVSQPVAVQPGGRYRLTAHLRGPGNLGVKVGKALFFEQQPKPGRAWREVSVTFATADAAVATVFGSSAGPEVRFDDFHLSVVEDPAVGTSARLIPTRAGGWGLSPDLPPGRNFDLLGWYLSTPGDPDGDGVGARIEEVDLARGATDPDYFYTGPDGGMVMRATVAGGRTSQNTRFTRTELREMLRRGDTSIRTHSGSGTPNRNNWVFSSAPPAAQALAGAVDGVLEATLAVNQVTSTGRRAEVGRVVIGQIHAHKDEPIRLYYRKLPEHGRGSIYAAHEPSGGKDIYVDLIGSRANDAPEPQDGIALDEPFNYRIEALGNRLTVSISQDGAQRARHVFDMTGSGYDVADDWMYFKAGVYNQNRSGDPDDAVQATFYRLAVKHGGAP